MIRRAELQAEGGYSGPSLHSQIIRGLVLDAMHALEVNTRGFMEYMWRDIRSGYSRGGWSIL